MHLAAWSGHASVVRVFIERGCDVNAKDKNGDTPLHSRVKHFTPYIAIILSLISTHYSNIIGYHYSIKKRHAKMVQ